LGTAKILGAQQKMSEDELSHINWMKRKKILTYAFNFVPFYKDKYQSAGMYPEDIRTREDFELIPILTKQEIRKNLEEMVSSNHHSKNLIVVSTGGSTGEPLKVYHDPNVKSDVFGWRMLEWWGIDPSVNTALAYRAVPRGISKLINKMMWFPTKRCFLDASYMTSHSIEKFLVEYERNKTQLIIGYVGAIHALAMYVTKHNITISPPKVVWTTSAPLPEFQRQYMQAVFGAPVFSQYGSCETFWLAAECTKQRGMHVFSDVRHMEFVNALGKSVVNNDYGKILVTDLENYACPIIRYENGDRGRLINRKCDCGINLPLMDTVKGREADSIAMPNGDMISGEFLTTIFDDFPDVVRAFQIKQSKDFSIELSFVRSSSGFNMNSINIVRDRLLKDSGDQVMISLKEVDEIPHERGKSKFVLSDVKLNYS
jgi:phenylacetate-CoA ligase